MEHKTLKDLLKEANSSIQSIDPNEAMDLIDNIDFLFTNKIIDPIINPEIELNNNTGPSPITPTQNPI